MGKCCGTTGEIFLNITIFLTPQCLSLLLLLTFFYTEFMEENLLVSCDDIIIPVAQAKGSAHGMEKH